MHIRKMGKTVNMGKVELQWLAVKFDVVKVATYHLEILLTPLSVPLPGLYWSLHFGGVNDVEWFGPYVLFRCQPSHFEFQRSYIA